MSVTPYSERTEVRSQEHSDLVARQDSVGVSDPEVRGTREGVGVSGFFTTRRLKETPGQGRGGRPPHTPGVWKVLPRAPFKGRFGGTLLERGHPKGIGS